ncbi:glycosyltransferase family 2 protein [Rhizohabitans arisaemae]|uniref:glycosyltransferase family 2 protein n=1 Tax=Rhizohabitans arisaemae TaxID=2720610 RepID=UPI0024B23DD8|nr:glycosyltransferase family A protein [Rhizohabitans arisaemae]
MGVKLTVIVAARDPGPAGQACVRSLQEQSMRAIDYDVVFIDRGSVDGTAEHLDAVVATSPNVRLFRVEPEVDPGRCWNLGIAEAEGEYVYLIDGEDRLRPDALRRMHAVATAGDADVLVGKVSSAGRPREVFRKNRERADILRDHLLQDLTARKLFRRGFLRAEGIEFTERGGEQVFVLEAYLKAKVVSVLADYLCCERGDARPGLTEIDAVLDVIDACTEPGPQRDRLYAHWQRVALRRGESLERFPVDVDRYLPLALRNRATLTREGHLATLAELARAEHPMGLRCAVQDLSWDAGVVVMDLTAELVYPGGESVRLTREGDRLLLRPPVESVEALDVTDAVEATRLDVFVQGREDREEYFLPAIRKVEVDETGRILVTAQARLDVGSAGLGRPLAEGTWDVHVRMRCGGYGAQAPLGPPGSEQAGRTRPGALAGYPKRLVVPYWTPERTLSLRVQPGSFIESIALVSEETRVARRDGHVYVGLPVPYVPPSGGPAVELVLRSGDRAVLAPALVEPGPSGRLPGQLMAKVPIGMFQVAGSLGPGSWTAALCAEGEETELRWGLQVAVTGRVTVCVESPAPGVAHRLGELSLGVVQRMPRVLRLVRALRAAHRR